MRCFSISALLGITGPLNILGFRASSHTSSSAVFSSPPGGEN